MDLYLLSLSVGPVGSTVAVGLVLMIGYQWGKYAAMTALAKNSPKWKAYALALLPPAVFAAAMFLDGTLQPVAGQTFLALATPASIGACVRINYGSFSPF